MDTFKTGKIAGALIGSTVTGLANTSSALSGSGSCGCEN